MLTFLHIGSRLFELFSKEVRIKKQPGRPLSQIRPLSCLKVLHTFDVSYNRLTLIANTTFEKKTKLRFIDLSHNFISDIEPFTFQQSNIHILSLNVEYNLLTSVEWSNGLLLKPSSVVSYAYNAISNITNRDRRYPDNKTFKENGERGGRIDLSNNSISTGPDPDILGLKNIIRSTMESSTV